MCEQSLPGSEPPFRLDIAQAFTEDDCKGCGGKHVIPTTMYFVDLEQVDRKTFKKAHKAWELWETRRN